MKLCLQTLLFMNIMHPLKKVKMRASRTLLQTGMLLIGVLLTIAAPAQLIYTTNDDNTLTVSGYTGTGGNVVIPNSVDGVPVVSIGDLAFHLRSRLTSVTIPSGVTRIGDGAFDGCSSLTNIVIPNSVTRIGRDTFFYCGSLTNIIIPDSIANIDSGAFTLCSSLTAIYFQGNAPALPKEPVFNDATNATVYYLPGTTGWKPTFDGRPTAVYNPSKLNHP